jgi:HPr kinase/phosphorylase
MPKDGEVPGAVSSCQVLGVEIPRVYITVETGRDIANVVETAALNMRLRHLGHDAEKELDERLISLLNKGYEASG